MKQKSYKKPQRNVFTIQTPPFMYFYPKATFVPSYSETFHYFSKIINQMFFQRELM